MRIQAGGLLAWEGMSTFAWLNTKKKYIKFKLAMDGN